MTGRHCLRCGHEHLSEASFCTMCGLPVPVLLGAHPGAGVSTLATATGFRDGLPPARSVVHPDTITLLVGRTHAAGLTFIRAALQNHRTGYARVLLVPDGPGKLPKPLRDQVLVISGVAPVTVAPWVTAWRHTPGVSVTKPVTTFITTLTAALSEQLPHRLERTAPHD